jgi:hypothetical protein
MLSPFVKKLLFARQINIDKQLYVLENKKVMVSPKAILDIQDNDTDKIYKEVKQLFLAETKGHKRRIGASSKRLLDFMVNLFETYGFGQFQILRFDSNTAVFNIIGSPFITKDGHKTCYFTAGALAGTMSVVFNKNADCDEESCISAGKNYCRFVVKVKKGGLKNG